MNKIETRIQLGEVEALCPICKKKMIKEVLSNDGRHIIKCNERCYISQYSNKFDLITENVSISTENYSFLLINVNNENFTRVSYTHKSKFIYERFNINKISIIDLNIEDVVNKLEKLILIS